MATVESYWDKTDDELYALLGAELLGEGLGLSPEDEEGQREFGREWFADKHAELQRRICHHEKVQPFLGTTSTDRLLDAITVQELIADFAGDAKTAVLIAVLVGRVGLGMFCRNAPEPELSA
ncbi:hypothetical protein GCM10010372_63050 [Streptomyces tauricus]|uniref:hypothetical protein n=1 Tax=Streptomyces tauricus TaxID=68274 RepID=UPI0016790B05|nr:hypothetical protein [Streptomyces tauricus]GHA54272.1 hypothetical protein GCM10010372_63050 [Streptomyces tauricus]